MASETEVFSVPQITKGPSRMDLLEAMFFHREKVLTFDLDKRVRGFNGNSSQLFAKLLGMIPTTMEQSSVLVLSYFEDYQASTRGENKRVVIVYDDHNRCGRFTWSDTLDELLDESWYTTREEGSNPGKQVVTIVVTPRSQMNAQGDYHAQIDKQPGVWGCGATPDEAVGNLVRSHSERFGLQDHAGLVDNPDLSYKDLGKIVRKDGRKFGIKIRM